ncbi:hypothetical protein DTO217A2_6801 [Paecilomyces variotii]|nr:hypothetical protein DTO217A2_6801 [Paecilomyces variotii]KAJ9374239.1 hypothetical protein DTO282E5_1161 [Paecilomyces variotii]
MATAGTSTVLDLGSSTLRLLDSDLRLTSYVFTKFIIPENSPISSDSDRLGEILKSRQCWVAPAPELILRVHVQGNRDSQSHASSYLKLVSEMFQYEKVWHDLGLTVAIKSCEDVLDPDVATDLSMAFNIQENSLATAVRRVPHQLLGLFRATAQPPPAIPRVTLSEVRLSLNFHSSNGKHNTPIIARSIIGTGTVALPCDEALQSCPILGYDPSFPPSKSEIRPAPFQLQFESLGRHFQSSGMQFKYYATGYGNTEDNFNSSGSRVGFHRLLGVCLDDIFATTHSKSTVGVESIKEETIYKLSDVAPTVFSPGYREAMQQRACFIPVIAKAMSSIIKTVDILTSSQRLSSLQGHYASHHGTDLDIDEVPNGKAMLKSLLWKIAQKGVYRVKAARKMRGFASVNRINSPVFESLFAGDDSILEDDVSSDNDLLDDERCEDDNSTSMLEEDLCSPALEEDMGYEEDLLDSLEMCENYESGEEEYQDHDDLSVLSSSEILDPSDQIVSSQQPVPVLSSSPLSFDHFGLSLSHIKQGLKRFYAGPTLPAENGTMALDKQHMRDTMYWDDIDEDMLH